MSNFSSMDAHQGVSWREYPRHPVVGVGGVVIDGDRVLLVRRGSAPLKGEWSIPGGTLELGETSREGVKRELNEETGLVVRVGDLIEVFERIVPDENGRLKYHFVILDYLCGVEDGSAQAGSDVTHVAWAREDDLAQYSLAPIATRVICRAFQMARGKTEGV
jgi:8-oxo-dGTP diphosphatase